MINRQEVIDKKQQIKEAYLNGFDVFDNMKMTITSPIGKSSTTTLIGNDNRCKMR